MSHGHRDVTLEAVPVATRDFEDYRPYAADAQFAAIRDRARRLQGLRVVEVNSTPTGGGVATMLHSVVPALQSLGLDATWFSMRAGRSFFDLTKTLFNLLQGESGSLSLAEMGLYLRVSERIGKALDQVSPDILVIHDPQPLGARRYLTRFPTVGSLWRVHLDLTDPNIEALTFLRPMIELYDRVVLEVPDDQLAILPAAKQRFLPDAIDPLTPKNRLIDRATARQAMARVGIDAGRPVVTQVARFDPLKNPIGVVDAYRTARRAIPGLQLAMLGTFVAQDDPSARGVYERVSQYVGSDPDVHLYTDPKVIGQPEVDAFQSGSDAILQFSRREGFGIAATEAMWKGNVVIAGDVGGLRYQIIDGQSGFLVDGVEACARRIVQVITDRPLAQQIGDAARQRVAQHFLLPRLIDDWLLLFEELVSQRRQRAA